VTYDDNTVNARLPRSTPEAQGIASAAVLAFVEDAVANLDELHSFMLLRHGNVVAEGWWAPYAADRQHMLFSLSKRFTSTAAGLAATEGRLSLDDTVLSFFPEDTPPEVGENLAAMRVRHLLAMATGHDEDTTGSLRRDPDGNWARAFLAQPVEHEPGTHFLYNSGATYMVSAIVQKVTGQRALDYLGPRLFAPLGIVGATWETCPRGIDVGGWGLNVTTEDIAKFGQLYLADGLWGERRLLPEGWVAEATAKQVSNGSDPNNDWNQGYGYQFWRCRHGAYRGDGAFGQFCVVLPAQDAVVAITAGIGDMGAVLKRIWERLLPAMGPKPLPEDAVAHDALRQRLAGLVLRTPEGRPGAATAARISGRTFHIEPNEQKIEAVTFDFARDEAVLTFRVGHADHRIICGGRGEWIIGETAFEAHENRPVARPVAASGAWSADDTFVAKLAFFLTPFCQTFTGRFKGDQLLLDSRWNVGFGPTEGPRLIGWATAANA